MDLETMFKGCIERGWLFSIEPDEYLSMDERGYVGAKWAITVWNIRNQRYSMTTTDIRAGFEEVVRALALLDKSGKPWI